MATSLGGTKSIFYSAQGEFIDIYLVAFKPSPQHLHLRYGPCIARYYGVSPCADT